MIHIELWAGVILAAVMFVFGHACGYVQAGNMWRKRFDRMYGDTPRRKEGASHG